MGKKSKQKASYTDNSNSKSVSNAKNKKGDKDTGRMIKIELVQSEETLLADIISAIEIDDYANNTMDTNTNIAANNDEEIELYDTIIPEDEKHHKTISKKKRYTDMTTHDKERFMKRLIRDDRYKRKQAEVVKKLDRYDKYLINKQTDEVAAAASVDDNTSPDLAYKSIINEQSHTYDEEDSNDDTGNDDDSISIGKIDDDDSNDDEDEAVNRNRNKMPSPGTIYAIYTTNI